MKKIIVLLILIVAAAAGATPHLIGSKVEETFRIEHQEAAKDAALSGFAVELVDYQRGYLDASATTRFSIVIPDSKEQQTISLEVQHHISHMPQIDQWVIATVDSELVLSDDVEDALDQLFKGKSPLEMKTRIFFDGHQEGSINSTSAIGQLGNSNNEMSVDWQGLNGNVWQSADRTNITFNIHSAGITMKPIKAEAVVEEEGASLQEFHYTGEMHRGESGMWNGNAEASIASISVDAKDKGMPLALLINSIGIKGNQSESSGKFSAGGMVSANSINVNGFMLSNAVYDVAIDNIDANAMVAWQETAAKMMQGKVDPEKAFEPMAEYIPALFNAQPVLRVNDLSVDSPMGRFAFKLNTSVNGQWDDMMLDNPAMIVPMLKVDLDANLPRAIVVEGLKKQIRSTLMQQASLSGEEIDPEEITATVDKTVEQQLGGMIAQGFIKEDEAQLQTHIVFAAGQLTVNGMDASPMLGGMMQ